MKYLLFLVLIATAFSCLNFKELNISDLSREQNFNLIANSETPGQYTLIAKGQLDGKAQLIVAWKSPDGNYSRVYQLNNKIDTIIKDEWYQSTMKLTYKPLDVTKGELLIKYSID